MTTWVDAQLGQRGEAVGDRAVEAVARPPEDLRAGPLRPVGDLVVVAHDVDGQRRGGGDDPLGHAPGQLGPLGRTEHAGQPALGGAEALDRHQDSGAHAGECTGEEREPTGPGP